MDMSDKEVPDADDINLKIFSGYVNLKYRVIDKKDSLYNKELFLYPMYGRLHANGSISYFKSNQITQVTVTQ